MDSSYIYILLLVSFLIPLFISVSGAAASAAGDLLTEKKKKDEKQRHVLKKEREDPAS